MKYKGWIPVASGYLSFTNIRGQIIPGRCPDPPTISGSLDGSELHVSATRKLLDRPLSVVREFFGADESYEFTCIAKRQDLNGEQVLSGRVIAHPRFEHDAANLLRKESTDPGIYPVALCWVIAFNLRRNGCVELDWGRTQPIQVPEIVDVDPEESESTFHFLTFESFSFLKDLIHAHKFHSIDDDSIVVPFLVQSESDDSWMDETARNIHRAIVSSIRNRPAQLGLANALGKIAYLRAFTQIAKTPLCLQLQSNLENLERVVNAALERERTEVGAIDTIRSIWMGLFVAAIATAITLFQLLQIPCIEGLTSGGGCQSHFSIPSITIQLTAGILREWQWIGTGIFTLMCGAGYFASRKPILLLYTSRTGNEKWGGHILRFIFGLALTKGKYVAFSWLTILVMAILYLIWRAIASLVN